ncbi:MULTISPECIES: AMP-binding protein [Bradyrhizobium]|uniref:AMP-binding protein n=1 Tax=Bradyrhizobium TaxID=374 RepID=UPI0009B794DB|nr:MULTISPECIES: AMP-binding protein [Bradyrhizobium]WLB88184.1 AMP-binding protein [Bradyrhizobium japonicum USDA 135]GLR95512.1 hypothetical protein GCM10007858_31480 [Bradyrhizobium liaoningense]
MPHSHEITTVPDIVRSWAARSPDRIALVGRSGSTSYGELDRRSNQAASRMLAAGLRPGDHVGYLGMNSAGFFDAWFAAGKIGCAFAPFNWRLDAGCPGPRLDKVRDRALRSRIERRKPAGMGRGRAK